MYVYEKKFIVHICRVEIQTIYTYVIYQMWPLDWVILQIRVHMCIIHNNFA